MTLQTQVADDHAREIALLKAIGFDKLSNEQRELALSVANRYGLDPMLRHLVMIDGKPYITRDGLLHVAHTSKQLDGIETSEPTLSDDGFWRSTCSVYRKDMSRPFTYTGRYPKTGQNQKFAPEMAVKVGEVMSLRRAFDIAAPTFEERWDVEAADVMTATPVEPASLSERVAQRVEQVQTEPTPMYEGMPLSPEKPETEQRAEAEAIMAAALPAVVEPASKSSDAMTLKAFAEQIEGVDRVRVKRVAKQLFPDVSKFAELSSDQLALLAETLRDTTDVEPTPEPDPTPTSGSSDEAPTVANGGIVLCGDVSPLSGATCTLDKNHPGRIHRNGTRESWEAKD